MENKQINNIMQKKDKDMPDTITQQPKASAPVNESGTVNISGFIKIHDPNTQEILMEARE